MTTPTQLLKTRLLQHYLKPLGKLGSDEFAFRNEINGQIQSFTEANKDLELHEYLERAKNKFGPMVEIVNTSVMNEKINSIETKVKYFFVLSIVSIIAGVLAALSTIK